MSRRRLLVCVLIAVAALPVQAHAAAEPWSGMSNRISGTFGYDQGEWIYTDFVYDDYGADTVPAGQSNVVSLASTTGDFRYPNGTTEAGNAADIVEVRARIAPNDADLEVRVLLQSIVSPTVPALRVEVNGTEAIKTAANADVDVDAETNTISFTLADAATTDEVKLNIGAGLNDGQGRLRAGVPGFAGANPGEFTTGAPTSARLFDLAFNTHTIEGRGGAWNENVQSAQLAAGNLAPFTQTISPETLRSGLGLRQRLSGYVVRIFESRQELGEGMRASFPQYRGKWQPYAIWIPKTYSGAPTPLFLSLHSLSVHHNQYRGGAAPSASYRSFYEQYEKALGAIVVTPLGRGPDGWYEDEALVDTLEVWADVLSSYTIDRERTYVGGYSMGGYGTYRLTTMMPDSFASAVSVVGPPANGIWAHPLPPTGGEANPDNTRPQLENTRHVPFWITQGVLDELVPVSGVENQAARFGELGHEYRFALHPVADHLSFVYQDEWTRESGWLASHPTRVTAPREITYKLRPASWATGGRPAILSLLDTLTAEIGARMEGAYWIDDVRNAPGTDVTGFVQLTTGGIARAQTGTTPVATVGTNGPSPHLLRGADKVFTDVSTTDTLSGTLSNVTELTVDVGRAGLSDSPVVSVQSNVPATITFVRAGVPVGSVPVG